jgi:hypothetical protein
MNSRTSLDKTAMPPHQWQVSLKGILWAAYWVAVCVVAWRAKHPTDEARWVSFITISFCYFPIPTAIGALFGHPWRGTAVGIALYVGLTFLLTIMVYLDFWTHSP